MSLRRPEEAEGDPLDCLLVGTVANPICCSCCGEPETEVPVDDISGLCMHCQPCPWCGRSGTGCDDRYSGRGCDPLPSPDGIECPPYEERQTMRF